jgi:hypothetical protein
MSALAMVYSYKWTVVRPSPMLVTSVAAARHGCRELWMWGCSAANASCRGWLLGVMVNKPFLLAPSLKGFLHLRAEQCMNDYLLMTDQRAADRRPFAFLQFSHFVHFRFAPVGFVIGRRISLFKSPSESEKR